MQSYPIALFDPEYLPEKLYYRDKELHTLTKLGVGEDPTGNALNVMVHGSYGVGRTTLLRFFGHHWLGAYKRPLINFHLKGAEEIVSDTLAILTGEQIQTAPLPEIWGMVKRILRKSSVPIIFTFDDVNHQTSETYLKFLGLCKELAIPSLATAPRYFPRQLTRSAARNLDFSLELEPFSDHQLLDIIVQRVKVAFPVPLSYTLTEYIADIICVLDFQRPATAIELLRNLYPLASETTNLDANHIRRACLFSRTLQYDFWHHHLATLANLDVSTVLLLQALGEYFTSHPGQLYVSQSCLFTQFCQVCEGIGLNSSFMVFSRALNELLFQDLLQRSRYDANRFFTLVPGQNYLDIVAVMLGEMDEY